ncbi:MAG: hypothetical protein BGO98_28750 [Myxococcales bacterium 68-20]|nr:MAG: hypothetical protein BGO98_28750 [Myxococcales bacterium 68-20]
MIALAACASNDAEGPAPSPAPDGDGGAPLVDAGSIDPTTPDADADAAAERALVCGEAGFCETRIPTDERGLPASLQGVWVVAPNDVWSVSAEGSILHYDGTSWTTAHRDGHPLRSIWATATSVWAGGEGGGLFHRGKTGQWSRVETGRVGTVRSIYGTSDDDVWFAFSDESVSHFDGTKLTNRTVDIPDLRITTVFGGSGSQVYAAGYVDSLTISEETGLFNYLPHVFEVSPTAIVPFNEYMPEIFPGFAPMSGAVIDAPGEERQLFLTGVGGMVEYKISLYMTIDRENMTAFGGLGEGYDGFFFDSNGGPSPPPHLLSVPIWARAWDDIYVPTHVGGIYRWTGTELVGTSLKMGYGFVPRPTLGIHGSSNEAWLVGDGYALKGPTL